MEATQNAQSFLAQTCLKKITTADALISLREFRMTDGVGENGELPFVEVDSRASSRSTNELLLLDKFCALNMKFQTKDRNEMLSLKSFFNAYTSRQTEALSKGTGKFYQMSFEMISKNEEAEIAYRTILNMPLMCFQEEYNGDYILHFLFETENVSFRKERYSEYDLKAELQYEEAQREEAQIKGNSLSSDLEEDDDNNTDDEYYINNM